MHKAQLWLRNEKRKKNREERDRRKGIEKTAREIEIEKRNAAYFFWCTGILKRGRNSETQREREKEMNATMSRKQMRLHYN